MSQYYDPTSEDRLNIGSPSIIDNIWDSPGGVAYTCFRAESDGATPPQTTGGRIFNKIVSSAGWLMDFRDESAGAMRMRLFQRFTTTDGIWQTAATKIVINTWYIAVVTYDYSSSSNDGTLYLNGEKLTDGAGFDNSTPPVGSRQPDAAEPMFIGNNAGRSFGFDGDMGMSVFWAGTMLSDGECLALTRGVNPFSVQRDKIVYYNPAWGFETTSLDYSGNGTSGTYSTQGASPSGPYELMENYL